MADTTVGRACLDHVVLWVEDPQRALAFWSDVVGLEPVRAEEFARGQAPFPSVRVDGGSIIDLMARASAPRVPGAASAGHPVNHVCLALDRHGFDALLGRLADAATPATVPAEGSFGARGPAVRSCYFTDPDHNVVEIRHYDEG